MESTLIPIDTGRRQPYLLEITSQEVAMRGLPKYADTVSNITSIALKPTAYSAV